MNILVTGGIGSIGRFTVAHLLAQGHRVRILDREAESDIKPDVLDFIQGADYHQADITDYVALRPYFDDIDAVVHLAAIPYPIPGKDGEIFNINCGGTFNVYQAAADAGIKRVVCASSINALGNNFGVRSIPVYYFPIDEAHPTWTSDVYSFSKEIVEKAAAYFWRHAAISSVCMRFPWVFDPAWFPDAEVGQYLNQIQQKYQNLQAMSDTERHAVLQPVLDKFLTLHTQQSRGVISYANMSEQMRDMPYREFLLGRNDFWAILDVRDAARAIQLALTTAYEGSHALFIADDHNMTGLPTAALAALFYPDVTTWQRPVAGTETLLSIAAARTLLNFEPQHSISRHQFFADS